MQAAEAFAGGEAPHDDATLFVGRVKEAIAAQPRWDAQCVAAPVAA